MPNTGNVINATDLYTLDWLMVNFMFCKFYLNLQKKESCTCWAESPSDRRCLRKSLLAASGLLELKLWIWTLCAQWMLSIRVRCVHACIGSQSVCLYTGEKGEPSELNFYSLILCFCNMLNLPNLAAVMKIIGTMTAIRLL